METRKLILEDGSEYVGKAFGSESNKVLELVFNTSMVGYQEILSDPSYTDQAVVMTYPLMGNYGINDDDNETEAPSIGALIAGTYTPEPSNFRCSQTLSDYMKKWDISGIYGLDTRTITRKIRNYGSCKALITDGSMSASDGVKFLKDTNLKTDQVSRVSTKNPRTFEAVGQQQFHVVAVDCGIKHNIIRSLNKLGCKVTLVPYNSTPEEVDAIKPDGIFLSNGPGDPTDVKETISLVSALLGRFPIFGICLGHQILSLACGAKTYKLKFGHRGGNHPVKNLLTGKLEITSQNHSYAVDPKSLEGTGLTVTHMNLLDDTIEGVMAKDKKAFSIQYHPESCPGPEDSGYLFGEFIKLMKGGEIYA